MAKVEIASSYLLAEVVMADRRDESPKKAPSLAPNSILGPLVTGLLSILVAVFVVFLDRSLALVIVIAVVGLLLILILLWYVTMLSNRMEKRLEENGDEIAHIKEKVDSLCADLADGSSERMSWQYFWDHVRKLQNIVEGDKEFRPDLVLSVGRAGAIVGAILAGNMDGLQHIGIDRITKWPKQRELIIIPDLQVLSNFLGGKKTSYVLWRNATRV